MPPPRLPLLDLAETILAPYREIAASACRMASQPEIERLKAHLMAPGRRPILDIQIKRAAAPERSSE